MGQYTIPLKHDPQVSFAIRHNVEYWCWCKCATEHANWTVSVWKGDVPLENSSMA